MALKCTLRRGAWYSVLSAGPEEAVLLVRDKPVILPRSHLEIVSTRPNKWTVVPRESGEAYAVCPNCAERVTLLRPLSASLACARCKGVFSVDRPRQTG
jgi:hypothetical protein